VTAADSKSTHVKVLSVMSILQSEPGKDDIRHVYYSE
jgi:hypothetical protein